MAHALLRTRFLMAETSFERLPQSAAEVAFVGRSNVGKSSLICAVTDNRKLAIVSKTPGRTRAINVFEAERGRWLVDLPGYGFAVGPQRERNYWPEMIGAYITGRPNLALVCVLLDAEIGTGPIDISMIQWLFDNKIPYRIVGVKVDKLGRGRQVEQRAKIAASIALNPEDIAWVSAKAGDGIKALRQEVMTALGL